MVEDTKPFPPPPEEPIRIFCPQQSPTMREAWLNATSMQNIEWCADWSKCKLMIFFCLPALHVSQEIADYMMNFFQRDGRESLVYEYHPLEEKFFEWSHDIFDRQPWRIISAS